MNVVIRSITPVINKSCDLYVTQASLNKPRRDFCLTWDVIIHGEHVSFLPPKAPHYRLEVN